MGLLAWWDNWVREDGRLLAEVDPRYEPFEYLMHSEEVRGFRDREGKRISADDWLALHGDMEYRTLAISSLQETSGEITMVLTAWLGVLLKGKTRFLFETTVLRGSLDGTVRKYKHEMDARVGHEQVILEVLERCPGALLLDEYRSY